MRSLLTRSWSFWLSLIFACLGIVFFISVPDRSEQVHKAMDHNLVEFLGFVFLPAFGGLCLGIPIDLLRIFVSRASISVKRSKDGMDKMKQFMEETP